MSNFNIVHNRLYEKGFKTVDNEEIEKIGFTLYENKKIRVLLKQVHTDIELDNIQVYSNQIRSYLMESLKNIYNSYLILCTEADLEYEKFFMIERNNVALRKYVVRDENDLNRIPFLDNTEDERDSKHTDFKGTEDNLEMNSIYSLLKEYNSKNIKLKDYQVDEIVNTLMQGMKIEL